MLKRYGILAVGALSLGLAAQIAFAQDDGQALYEANCSVCHQKNGAGLSPHLYPALAGDAFLLGEDDKVVSLIMKGRAGMPSWINFLKDDQIAKILTYARGAWGNGAPAIAPEKVADIRKSLRSGDERAMGN